MKQTTLGELKASGYKPLTIKEELRINLRKKTREERTDIHGNNGIRAFRDSRF